jgi:hypothetical protein
MLPFTQQKEVDYAAVIEKHKGDKSGKKILMHVHASSHKEEGGADAIVLSHPTPPLAPPHRISKFSCHLTAHRAPGGSPKSPSPKRTKPAKGAKGKIVDNPLSKADDNEVAPSATCVHVTRTQPVHKPVRATYPGHLG